MQRGGLTIIRFLCCAKRDLKTQRCTAGPPPSCKSLHREPNTSSWPPARARDINKQLQFLWKLQNINEVKCRCEMGSADRAPTSASASYFIFLFSYNFPPPPFPFFQTHAANLPVCRFFLSFNFFILLFFFVFVFESTFFSS